MTYVVAFNRDRDSYQVPMALAEHGLLAGLATDACYSDNALLQLLPWMRKLRHRHADGLPSRLVTSDWYATLLQIAGPRLGLHPHAMFRRVDEHLSSVAASLAERLDADLFLDRGYAYKAFTAPQSRGRRRGLFVFHPHNRRTREVLLADYGRYGELRWSIEKEGKRTVIAPRIDPAIAAIRPDGVELLGAQPRARRRFRNRVAETAGRRRAAGDGVISSPKALISRCGFAGVSRRRRVRDDAGAGSNLREWRS